MFMEWPFLVAIAVITGALSQVTKFIVKLLTADNDDVRSFFSYGGFPSSHAALVSAVATVAGIVEGINSLSFMISFVIGFLIIRDALGLRNYVNKNLEDVQRLVQRLPKEERKEFHALDVTVGHTRTEILAGMIFGVAVSGLLYWLSDTFLF